MKNRVKHSAVEDMIIISLYVLEYRFSLNLYDNVIALRPIKNQDYLSTTVSIVPFFGPSLNVVFSIFRAEDDDPAAVIPI